jgi:hypothetical protein
MAAREHSGVRSALPAVGAERHAVGGEGGLAASDGFGPPLPAAPPAGHGASARCSGGASAQASLLSGGLACTRRDVLAGAVAGAALPSPSPLRGGPSPLEGEGVVGEWESALAALRAAEAEMAAFKAAEPTDVSFEQQWALDEAFSDLVVGYNRAVERVLLAAAPDLGALAAKVALAVDEQAWELPEGEAAMARLKADSRRLAG